ncbi:hypothetical protein [Aquimarina sp. AU474]|uniref:hypothetical protein n=1 Tax=Aquimarina sp. AU474 TaxID=2108529 RepID=UPI0013568486|nr:hypothetical protein [Aquimarina sp. AU474]
MLSEFIVLIFLELLSGFSAIMIGLLFLTIKSKNQTANFFLILFLWCLSWVILTGVYFQYTEEQLLDTLYIIDFDPVLLLVPALFIYIIITINKSFNSLHLLLFLPGIIINIFYFQESEIFDIISILFTMLFDLTLMIIAFRVLIKHKKKVADYYSELEFKTLSWIKSIILSVFILHFFIFFGEVVSHLSEMLSILFMCMEILTTLFIVYWIGYNGFFQAQLFLETNNSGVQ